MVNTAKKVILRWIVDIAIAYALQTVVKRKVMKKRIYTSNDKANNAKSI